MDSESTKRNTLPIKIAVIALVVLAYVGITMYAKNSRESKPENTASNNTPAQQTNGLNTTAYKNGTYTATGTYNTPGGPEEVTVSITLVDGIVTATSSTAVAKAPVSAKFQEEFINSYQNLVVGKNINEVQLDKVAGSSLTPKGFNEAVNQIKTQASNS